MVDGGRVLVLDLQAHTEHWTKERLGDHWLGFGTEAVAEMMGRVGLVDLVVRPATDDTGDDPFGVLTAVGTKPTSPSPSGRDPVRAKGHLQR